MRQRAIIHLDLDAFYAQVEQVRLKLSPTTPLICIQWAGILAVSYSARKFGISRKDSIQEAKRKCPELVAVHVPVIKGGSSPAYVDNPDIKTCKTSLITYRNASERIMKIIKQNTKVFQKASVDEVFIDVSQEANLMENVSVTDLQSTFQVDKDGSFPIQELVNPTDQDLLLLKAAKISSNLREKIYNELGYTCSTGISVNKTLAKLVSSSNKPNKQTVLFEKDIVGYIGDVSVGKIRNLGGKLGNKLIHEFQIDKCKELWSLTSTQIAQRLGIDHSQANWIYGIVRGECDEAVKDSGMSKSMASCKNFSSGLTDQTQIQNWILNLSNELFMRLQDESRWPRTITLILRLGSDRITKQTPMMHRDECNSPEDIESLVNSLYPKDVVSNRKILFIGISVSKFDNLGNTKSIGYFFQKETNDKELLEIVDQNGFNLYHKCLDCGRVMKREERMAHEDFHFAKKLNFETNSVGVKGLGFDMVGDGGVEVVNSSVSNDTGNVASSSKDRKDKEDSIKDMLEAVDSYGNNLYHKCLECGDILEQRHRQEHEDYHFAFRISNNMKSSLIRKDISRKSGQSGQSGKLSVSKKSKTGMKSAGPSIKSFFKKL